MHQSRAEQLLQKAASHQKAGRLEKSAELCAQILRLDAKHSDALHLLGIITHQRGEVEAAIQLIVQSLTISPDNVSALGNLGTILKDEGRYDKALTFYESAIALSPNEPGLLSNCGIVLGNLKRHEEAVACYERSLALKPRSPATLCNMGTALQALRRYDAARECYERALAIDPREHHTISNLATLSILTGRFTEALDYAEKALRINPDSEAALSALSAGLKHLGHIPEAITACWRMLEVNPRSYLAYNNLALALGAEGRAEEALGYLQKAVDLNPTYALSHNNIGLAYRDLARLEESIRHMVKAVELEPDNGMYVRNLGTIYYDAGMAEESAATLRRSVELDPTYSTGFSDMLYALNYLPHDPAQLYAKHLEFVQRYCEPVQHLALPHMNQPDPDRPLRIGYVSGDFRGHPVAHFVEPLFAHYTRRQFEVFCYANQAKSDETTKRFREMVDHWRKVDDLSDDALAAAIREDGIDILVDLSGHTMANRLLVFARKPAPVQVTMIGYMQTTGLAAIDYRLTDDVMDPPEANDAFSSEKLVRLPNGPASFQFHRESPPVSELPALTNGYMTFGSFHNLAKVNATVIETWAKVLEALPDSRIIIVGRNSLRAGTALRAHGIAAERIKLYDRQGTEQYLALHHGIDLVLDTFPFNGYTTSLISAWMGVPSLTISGNNTVSRVGESLLRRMGIPDLVAADPADYVRKAAAVAGDLPRMAQWRAALRPRLAAWAGDGSTYISELENAYRDMWRRWCNRQQGISRAPVPQAALARAAA